MVQLITLSTPTRVEVELGYGCCWAVTILSCFKKVRIGRNKSNPRISELFEKRLKMKFKTDEESRAELENIENKLSDLFAVENMEKIREEVKLIDCEEGCINSGKLRSLKENSTQKSVILQQQCLMRLET